MHKFLEPLPRIVAHRGDSAFFPENTIPAFQSAAELGVDVIETDVHLTKDGKIVIWHDPTLERNTDGKGRIEDHTYSELLEYDAGYNFTTDGETYPFRGKGVHLALLDEALKALEKEGISKAALVVFERNKVGNAFWQKMGFSLREDIIYRNRSLKEVERIDT